MVESLIYQGYSKEKAKEASKNVQEFDISGAIDWLENEKKEENI